MRLLCVAGARPNFMKVKPVLDALEAQGVDCTLVHTGQHYDPGLSSVFFEDLGLREPDHHLGAGSGTQAEQTASVMVSFEALLDSQEADMVVVVGDVNSTLATALVTAKSGRLLAHVEAGLRSRDWTMPEEINRVVTDRISDLLFSPSEDATHNLLNEGISEKRIQTVGNVMVDTLLSNRERARGRGVARSLGINGRYGIVTLHRPTNVDEPARMGGILAGLGEVATQLPLVFPLHPRTEKALASHNIPENIFVTPPMGYLDFLELQSEAVIALTDSGGIQEETTILGIPCLTLRDTTERPITVSEGTNTVVGTQRERIVAAAQQVLDEPPPARRPSLWDGKAGERIAEVIGNIDPSTWPRPTARV